MTKRKYEIRYLNDPLYYCILWIDVGQNIFISRGHPIQKPVLEFEKGNSRFKDVEDLYNYVYAKWYGERSVTNG